MPSFAEEEFQAHISFVETDQPADPLTSPPAVIGSLGPPGALAGRSYRSVVHRISPLPNPPGAAVGIYYLTTDYDVAMADLDYNVECVGTGGTLRVGDLVRIGSFIDASGRTRGVYRVRVAAVSIGIAGDDPDGLVTITMKRVDPNLRA